MTSVLRRQPLAVEAADDPADGVLPVLTGVTRAGFDASAAPYPDMARNLDYGHTRTLLPYTNQSTYTRVRSRRELPSIVLENEHLTATFLPGSGGRLWSLAHRPTGRELLHRNPVYQPANLALRDAWLAGGVEWNLGATGHWPLTCSPLHAVGLTAPDGTPVLRMFEFERLRRTVLVVDAWLPPGSEVLFVHVAITNPAAREVPVYWWSNIAVPQGPDVRVIAPAERAFHFDYHAELNLIPFPQGADDSGDHSYPARFAAAADYFMDVPVGTRPWITALDADGRGLAQVSTGRLSGRKLFQWGTGTGGRRWQEWLSGPGTAGYIEIQAGLARTQLEHLPLPGRTTWEWVEAYGLATAEAAAVHGGWDEAREAAGAAVDRLAPAEVLDAALETARRFGARAGDGLGGTDGSQGLGGTDATDRTDSSHGLGGIHDTGAPQMLHHGSGWGALEVEAGYLTADPALPFGPCDADQKPWLDLLRTGVLPPSEPPALPVTGTVWRELLEESAPDWHALYHLGLLRLADGDEAGAREAWDRSLAERPTPWVLRSLAQLDPGAPDAADRLLAAHRLLPVLRELTIETVQALLAAGRPAEVLELAGALSEADREHGRIRLHTAQAAAAIGDLERVRRMLDEGIAVDNLREGEACLDALWLLAFPERPVPPAYDFRMTGA